MKRDIRKTAHLYFDILWLYKFYNSGKSISFWRNKQYKWLSKKMGISRDSCHMSKMTIEDCKKVIDICSLEYDRNEKLLQFAEEFEEGIHFSWYRIK